ncbi:hypothetical protein, partial [Streptomyces sp. NPDC055990]
GGGTAVGLQRHEIWVDLGLSGLTKWLGGPWFPGTTLRGMLVDIADWGDGGFAPLLLDDVLRVLDSPLPVRTVDTVLCAALGRGYGPDVDGPGLLREIADVCVERLRRDDPSFVPALPGPSVYGVFEGEVLGRLAEVAPAVREAVARAPFRDVPDVVGSLERFVTEVDPELGFRLFLRVLKVYAVPVGASRREGYLSLGERFGWHEDVVDDGNLAVLG